MPHYMNGAVGYGMDMNPYYNQYQQPSSLLPKPLGYPSYASYDQSGQSLLPTMPQRVTQGWARAGMGQLGSSTLPSMSSLPVPNLPSSFSS